MIFSRWLWPGNRTFVEEASMVVTWWIVALLRNACAAPHSRKPVVVQEHWSSVHEQLVPLLIPLIQLIPLLIPLQKPSRITRVFLSVPAADTMVGPVQRRKSSPAVVQQLWAGIQLVRSQKQIPNVDRLVRYMTRNQGKETQVVILTVHQYRRGDKVSMLTHTYPHKLVRKIRDQADSPLYVWPNIWSRELQV